MACEMRVQWGLKWKIIRYAFLVEIQILSMEDFKSLSLNIIANPSSQSFKTQY